MALSAEELTIRYLGWAGVELRYGANAVFIDPQLFALHSARLLGAQTVVPIHFGRAPSQTYIETDAPERRFVDEARRLGQAVRVLRAGDELKLAAIA